MLIGLIFSLNSTSWCNTAQQQGVAYVVRVQNQQAAHPHWCSCEKVLDSQTQPQRYDLICAILQTEVEEFSPEL